MSADVDPRTLDGAACRGCDPALWFPEKGDVASERAARATCAICPVIDACREYAINNWERWGVWGGLSQNQLRMERRRRVKAGELERRAPNGKPLRHGTDAGWRRCRKLPDGACVRCKNAHRIAWQFRRPSRAKRGAA